MSGRIQTPKETKLHWKMLKKNAKKELQPGTGNPAGGDRPSFLLVIAAN
jgi:hypothetical protein